MRNSTPGGIAPLALVAALLCTCLASLGSAQPAGTSVTIHTWTDPAIATLMLVDTIAIPNARAVVIRRPGDMPNNIILVTRATTPAELSKAVTALIVSRQNQGDHVDREMRTYIAVTPPGGKRAPSEGKAAADLKRIRSFPPFEIDGIGRGPALVIRMNPPKTKPGAKK